MRAIRPVFVLVLLLLALVACQPPAEEDAAPEINEQEWQALKTAKESVDQKRAERDELQEKLRMLQSGEAPAPEAPADGAEGEGGEEGAGDAEAPMTAEELEARIAELAGEINSETDELARAIPEFMNTYFDLPVTAQGQVDDAALTPMQREAIEMKVDEDIVLAKDYIRRGGEYDKALDIYQAALVLAPNYAPLTEAIADAETHQYMTEERFAQVEKKMTQDQVRELLGTVKRTNVRDYPEKKIVAWFYRRADGGAAGVYYKESKDGAEDWTVYQADFEAVKPPQAGGEADTGDAEAPPEG